MENLIGVAVFLIWVVILLIPIISLWVIFSKANEPGWAIIVPIYGALIFLRVAGKPWWWIFLLVIPLINIVIIFLAILGLAQRFGFGAGMALGIFFLPFIFYPVLAVKAERTGSTFAPV